MINRKVASVLAVVALIATVWVISSKTMAVSSSSNNFKVDEYQFGVGANNDLNSSSYNANASIGSLGVGRSASTNYAMEAGFVTPNAPFLELFINDSSVDMGTLDASTTSKGNATFWVRSYVSSNYVVQTMSSPPTSEGGRVLAAKSTPGPATVGTEEFGMNLVANSASFGANPFNVPDDNFADGTANTGYDTTDVFSYNQGDIIAKSSKTSSKQAVGRTDYTVSYIANVNAITPAGNYVMIHNIVVTSTY